MHHFSFSCGARSELLSTIVYSTSCLDKQDHALPCKENHTANYPVLRFGACMQVSTLATNSLGAYVYNNSVFMLAVILKPAGSFYEPLWTRSVFFASIRKWHHITDIYQHSRFNINIHLVSIRFWCTTFKSLDCNNVQLYVFLCLY